MTWHDLILCVLDPLFHSSSHSLFVKMRDPSVFFFDLSVDLPGRYWGEKGGRYPLHITRSRMRILTSWWDGFENGGLDVIQFSFTSIFQFHGIFVLVFVSPVYAFRFLSLYSISHSFLHIFIYRNISIYFAYCFPYFFSAFLFSLYRFLFVNLISLPLLFLLFSLITPLEIV